MVRRTVCGGAYSLFRSMTLWIEREGEREIENRMALLLWRSRLFRGCLCACLSECN